MTGDIDWADVERSIGRTFPQDRPLGWRIVHLLFHNLLTETGDIKREVELCLESKTDGLVHYEWRIPLPSAAQHKVHGLTVRKGTGEMLDFHLDYVGQDGRDNSGVPVCTVLRILFPAMETNESVTLRFEYFIEGYASMRRKGLFGREWRYSWGYHVHSETSRLEHRVVLPRNCALIENGVESAIGVSPFKFRYGQSSVIVWSVDDPGKGSFVGEVDYWQESSYGSAAVSLAGGAAIGGLTALATGTATLTGLFAVFGISLLGVVGTVFFGKRFLRW